ncbi:MAG: hypothetical protein ACQEQN_10380 [Thermodesulfobacteriota bacterium]
MANPSGTDIPWDFSEWIISPKEAFLPPTFLMSCIPIFSNQATYFFSSLFSFESFIGLSITFPEYELGATNIVDGFVKSPISALRTIFEESHVRLSTLNPSKIARALILSRHGVITLPSKIDFLRFHHRWVAVNFSMIAFMPGLYSQPDGSLRSFFSAFG